MILALRNVTKVYERGGMPFPAVDGVDLSLDADDFAIILGRSGSGKSTLLNMIAGLLAPTHGSIKINGKNILSLNDREASLFRNSAIGYIPQGQSILANLTVLDNVRLPFYLFKHQGNAMKKAVLLLEQTGILQLANSYPQQLSGGEMRRVAIARALINEPELLIADEPTGDLDTTTTAEIMNLFNGISRNGTAVLMVTHDPNALDYGNRIFRMDAGILSQQIR
ncbi:MAG TPA: ABC transporter ATP-binding protein [Syntrophomonas sp.]|nr:ABC transporter ATP-binding protein [Syntrophomonas sp.]